MHYRGFEVGLTGLYNDVVNTFCRENVCPDGTYFHDGIYINLNNLYATF